MNYGRRLRSSDSLTRRELDVLLLMSEGLSNHEISGRLSLEVGTVKWYANQIYAKLEVHSRTKAVAHARRVGLIDGVISPDSGASASGFGIPIPPLIGRKQELAQIVSHLSTPTCRLLTLIGAPGVGKTRLSLHVAATLEAIFPDGVYFVPLAAIVDPDSVISVMGGVLGIAEFTQKSPLDTIKRHLRRKTMLLLLDNFEQVLAAAPLLADLLSAAPELKLLVTSREPLHLYGEQQFPVPVLPLPDLSLRQNADALRQNDAVALFVQRARMVQHNFDLTEANAQVVAEVCVRLDGLPLAIELAAARVKLHPPAAILARLNDRLNVLADGPRDAPDRQRTMRSALDWSYSLLHPHEQLLFAFLGTFVGGWTPDAAQAMCDVVMPQHAHDIETLLSSLLDKNLLLLEEVADDETRYSMLETLREYAIEKLAETGQLDLAQQAHAGYFLSLAERAKEGRYSSEQQHWMERLTAEYRNLLAAFDHYHERADGAESELRMMDSLGWFWHTTGNYHDGYARARSALARDSDLLTAEARASAYYGAARMERAAGNYARAVECYENMLTFKRTLEDERGMVRALVGLAITAYLAGDLHKARQVNEEAINDARRRGEFELLAELHNNQGLVSYNLGEFAHAQMMFATSLEIARQRHLIVGTAQVLHNMGCLAFRSGEDARAIACFEESIDHAKRVGSRRTVVLNLLRLGEVAFRQDDYGQAESYIDRASAINVELAHADLWVEETLLRAQIADALDSHQQAIALLRSVLVSDSLTLFPIMRNLALDLYAGLLVKEEQGMLAASLLGAIEPALPRLVNVLHPIEHHRHVRTVELLRKTLGDAAFAAAFREGSRISVDEAIRSALEVPVL